MSTESEIQRWLGAIANDDQRMDCERAAARLLIKSPRLLMPQCFAIEPTLWLEGCIGQVFVPSALTTLQDEIRVQDEVYAAGVLIQIAKAQVPG